VRTNKDIKQRSNENEKGKVECQKQSKKSNPLTPKLAIITELNLDPYIAKLSRHLHGSIFTT
jgi:hypothetical protein